MDAIEGKGSNVDEAISNALDEIGAADKNDVDIEIIEEGKKGLLGIGSKEAVVKVSKRVSGELLDDIKDFASQIMQIMGFAAEVDIQSEEDGIYVDVSGRELAILIGRRGETLKALQTIISAFCSHKAEQKVNIILDIEGYLRRRNRKLEEMAIRTAEKAITTGKTVTMIPMSAAERRIVHMTIGEINDVTTASEGEEPYRQVMVIPESSR